MAMKCDLQTCCDLLGNAPKMSWHGVLICVVLSSPFLPHIGSGCILWVVSPKDVHLFEEKKAVICVKQLLRILQRVFSVQSLAQANSSASN